MGRGGKPFRVVRGPARGAHATRCSGPLATVDTHCVCMCRLVARWSEHGCHHTIVLKISAHEHFVEAGSPPLVHFCIFLCVGSATLSIEDPMLAACVALMDGCT